MSDHSEISATSTGWGVLAPDIVEHVVGQLDPLLPRHLALLVAGPQVVLTTTNGTPRVVGTLVPRVPIEIDRSGLADVVADVLDDIQDLVITHLATPWPLTESGKGTHPSAELVGTALMLRFSSRDGIELIELIELQPYEVPENPPKTVVAG
jgi:hypothetical protein